MTRSEIRAFLIGVGSTPDLDELLDQQQMYRQLDMASRRRADYLAAVEQDWRAAEASLRQALTGSDGSEPRT